jgi:hypothetical protein
MNWENTKKKSSVFFKDFTKFVGNNDLTNMMKNNDKGFSMKKVVAMMISITFCYLQMHYWSDANGPTFLTIDAGLITSILITNAVQQGKVNSDTSSTQTSETTETTTETNTTIS